jgi:disintegrin and metalloproteinase domain-containing protein 10
MFQLEPKMALCGNGVVEEGEECDCGWEEDCEEECCWPQRTEYPTGEKPCTLRPKKLCSPTQVIYMKLHLKLILKFIKCKSP